VVLAGARHAVVQLREQHEVRAAGGEQPRRVREVPPALDAYGPRAPVVIGGDLNTFSLGLAEVADRDAVAAALRADPERWRRPERHEPLFALAEARGYAWRAANRLAEPTHRHATESGSARGQLKLDWLLVRGLEAADPAVLDAAHPATGAPLSDHEMVAATVVAPA